MSSRKKRWRVAPCRLFLHILAFSSAISFRYFCHLFKSILQTRQFFKQKSDLFVNDCINVLFPQKKLVLLLTPMQKVYISKSRKLKRLITDLEVHQDGVLTTVCPLKWQLSYMCCISSSANQGRSRVVGIFCFYFSKLTLVRSTILITVSSAKEARTYCFLPREFQPFKGCWFLLSFFPTNKLILVLRVVVPTMVR